MKKLIAVIFSVLILANSIACFGSGEEKKEDEKKPELSEQVLQAQDFVLKVTPKS